MITPLRVLEFFSGIGGMRMGLELSGIPTHIVCAFDTNTVANTAYKASFGETPRAGDICSLTTKKLDAWDADVWTMSPPCQPYTRLGNQRDHLDIRASALLCLTQRIREMCHPPRYILLENVHLFQRSVSFSMLYSALLEKGYTVRAYLISPVDCGVPNSRLRFFLLAKLRVASAPLAPQREPTQPIPPLHPGPPLPVQTGLPRWADPAAPMWVQTLARFLASLPPSAAPAPPAEVVIPAAIPVGEETTVGTGRTEEVEEAEGDGDLGCGGGSYRLHAVGATPLGIFMDRRNDDDRSLWLETYPAFAARVQAMDLVGPQDDHTCCFTKGYTKLAEGAGSVFRMANGNLRFFHPLEIARLHCFPAPPPQDPYVPRPPSIPWPLSPEDPPGMPGHPLDFGEVTLRQRYRLLGNSLNSAVVGVLFRYLVAGFSME
ncbi:putative dna methyltransferase-2 [Paratrimastix pyriformis]|uniref:Dna methyltransferase-2 n=1 Tax=Paratrimastix pyriformis TaxID=342808 RepID=A0ABQ8UHW8_9EUKA|nr:putative dna methyltransferase-2 [Paratrimastix pyriformis]